MGGRDIGLGVGDKLPVADAVNRDARSIMSVGIMLGLAREEGIEPNAALKGSGIAAADLARPDAVIRGEQEVRVIENLLRLGVDASFAFRAGTRYRISAFGMLGYALMNCERLVDVAVLCFRYHALSYALCRLRTELDGQEGTLYFEADFPGEALRAFVVERDMAALASVSRDLTGHRLPLRRWWLAHKQQAPLAVYQSVVRGTPDFERPSSCMVFSLRDLDTPLPLANEVTLEQCTQTCEELMRQRQLLSGLNGRVRGLLMRNADCMPSMEEMASMLHMTPRTLRRRLADEGTTYRDLQHAVRHTLAESMLLDGRLSLQQVAERLGYQDVTTFITAFKRWSGVTPAHFRRTGGALPS